MKENVDRLRKEITEIGIKLYERGYIAANDGNISARINKNRVLITPTRMRKGSMKTSDLSIIDMTGKLITGKRKPSSECDFHVKIYRDRRDVNSVCHAHPPYATGFAVAGVPLDKMILPEVIIRLGVVPIVDYGTPGHSDLYDQIHKKLKDHDAFLLANHGAITVGNSVMDAYDKMETLEHLAKIQFIAHLLGNVNTLTPEQVEKLIPLREKFGARKDLSLE
ncbi:MAG TPA: class II aldolase/adducin family protein [Candidatus Acidoferrales bacterium]|nr:class II aldolase/adducin family protein [Candidatus Acidoferrales bacterium]